MSYNEKGLVIKYNWHDFYHNTKETLPSNAPEARGDPVKISCFVDTNHAGNQKGRCSQTGILIFINKAPIHWFSKRQATGEVSIFGAKFWVMRTAVKMIETLQYKLCMFGVPIDGPTNIFRDNEVVAKKT